MKSSLTPVEAQPRDEIFAIVCRHMRKLTGAQADDYDELVQIAAERALRDLPKFEGRSSLSTWAFRVCYSSLIDYRRASQRFLRRFIRGGDDKLLTLAVDRPHADVEYHWQERNLRLHRALQRIGAKRATVVNLHDLQGMDAPQIAELLGIGEGTVRSRLRDGRNELARRLKGDPYFDEPQSGREYL